jgi:hypothetical protein
LEPLRPERDQALRRWVLDKNLLTELRTEQSPRIARVDLADP